LRLRPVAQKILAARCRSGASPFDYGVTANSARRATTMQYMLLIYHNEANRPGAAEEAKLMEEYRAFTQEIVRTGKFKAGDRLESSATATTVRVRDGRTTTFDGPFAETKEQLGGYYIVEANDLDEAIAIAARIPGARWGSIEVRPVANMTARPN
jgi:hypothetical protein